MSNVALVQEGLATNVVLDGDTGVDPHTPTVAGCNATRIMTNTTTPVKATAGIIRSLFVNAPGGGGNTLQVRTDGADLTAALSTTGWTVGQNILFGLIGIRFSASLEIITAVGTPCDVLVLWD